MRNIHMALIPYIHRQHGQCRWRRERDVMMGIIIPWWKYAEFGFRKTFLNIIGYQLISQNQNMINHLFGYNWCSDCIIVHKDDVIFFALDGWGMPLLTSASAGIAPVAIVVSTSLRFWLSSCGIVMFSVGYIPRKFLSIPWNVFAFVVLCWVNEYLN